MRKNKLLSVAVAATLSLPMGMVHAGIFQNANCTNTASALSGCAAGPFAPVAAFGFSPNPLLVQVPNAGTVYALEIFGGDTAHPKLPNSAAKKAAALYTIDGGVAANFTLSFQLSEGEFDGQPQLAISNANYTTIPLSEGGSSTSFAKFVIGAGAAGRNLANGDQLMFVYQIKGTTSLANADGTGKVQLSVSLVDDTSIPVNSPGTVTIATSKQAVKTDDILAPENSGSVKISVTDDSKKFAADGVGPAFQNTLEAQIGLIQIINANASITDSNKKIKESDGETDFLIGQGTDGKVTGGNDDGAGSILKITGGQFAASKASAKKVFINTSGTVIADGVDETGTEATFKLDDAKLQDIADEPSTSTPIGLRLQADGSTAINVTENAPQATLDIDFVQSYVKDITAITSDLLQISKNGTVCVVYNLPAPGLQDQYSLRITNTSNVAGKLSGKLYGASGGPSGSNNGAEIASGDLNSGNALQPGETIVLHSVNHADTGLGADGFNWEGRAMLEITSTLPNLEMMVLSRRDMAGAPLSNHSVGATGISCTR